MVYLPSKLPVPTLRRADRLNKRQGRPSTMLTILDFKEEDGGVSLHDEEA